MRKYSRRSQVSAKGRREPGAPMTLERQLIVTMVLALVVGVCTPVYVHRRDFDAAFLRWRHQPTAENEAVMKVEAKKNSAVLKRSQIESGALAFAVLNLIWAVGRLTQTRGAPGSRPFLGR